MRGVAFEGPSCSYSQQRAACDLLTSGQRLKGSSLHPQKVQPTPLSRATRTGRRGYLVTSAVLEQAPAAVPARAASVKRATKETRVDVSINVDGTGVCTASSQIPFLDHMLDQLASHGLFNVMVQAEGDTWIDDHHTCEDIALSLGSALSQALGDRKGIHRFGDFTAPLDEALVHVVLDLSGRPHLSFDCDIPTERIGTFDTQLVEHFFSSLATTGGITLHIRKLAGKNSHHIVEATFKAFARALRKACEVDPRRGGQIASSKGVLTQN